MLLAAVLLPAFDGLPDAFLGPVSRKPAFPVDNGLAENSANGKPCEIPGPN